MKFFCCRSLAGGALLVALVILLATSAFAQAPRYALAPTRVEIGATPITSFDNRDPSQIRFGALEFRGGLELT